MAKQTKGKCKFCGKEYTKGYMVRHLTSCKERRSALEAETGKRTCGYYELVITARYDKDYWLIIEMRETATLADLDDFLRDIWLECCGHLSAFDIYGERYESDTEGALFWGESVKGMNHKLSEVFEVGMDIMYEYDFGSTTELVIHVQDYRWGYYKQDKKLTILSRNNAFSFVCGKCGKEPAEWFCPYRMYDGWENPFLCEECSELPENEDETMLAVCNSPTMGVCGYNGSTIYPDQFVSDTEDAGTTPENEGK